MEEVWKEIPGFNGVYEISNVGNLRNSKTGKIIKPYINNTGYYIYNLWQKGKQYKFLAHRLIAQAFIPNPNNYPEIDHIDGKPENNRVENLRWVTHKENSNTEIRKKRLSESHKGERHIRWGKFGKDNPCSKKIGCFQNGILIREYVSYTEAQNDGFSRKGIYRNVTGITPEYKGFIWKELR